MARKHQTVKRDHCTPFAIPSIPRQPIIPEHFLSVCHSERSLLFVIPNISPPFVIPSAARNLLLLRTAKVQGVTKHALAGFVSSRGV
jgi:hypothetical protein